MRAWVYVLPTVGTGGPGCVPCSGLLPTCPLRVPYTCLPRVTGHHRSTLTMSSESHSRLQQQRAKAKFLVFIKN